MALTPRERVLTAVNHQVPDRVPLALWGSWYGVTDKLYFEVMQVLGWEPVSPFRPDRKHSVNHYDDRLLAELGVDVRHVDPGIVATTSRAGNDRSDGWGLRWSTTGLYRTASHFPLETASVDEILTYPLPDARSSVQIDSIQARLKEIAALDQEFAVVGRAISSYGFFEMAQSLRKHEQLLLDLVLAPEVVDALVSRLLQCYSALTISYLDVAGHELDLLELPGDDLAGNKGPIISPAMFDRFFKEPYRQWIQLIKEHSPHIKVIYHSDGAITPFLDRLIDIGIDIVHPLEPLPATDMAAVKAQYGHRLAFLGGIDIREALQGSEGAVIREVQTRLALLAPGGGYILAPANHLQWDVSPQNLFTLYEAAREYGRYE